MCKNSETSCCELCKRAVVVGTVSALIGAAIGSGVATTGAAILSAAGYAGYPITVAAIQGGASGAIFYTSCGGLSGFIYDYDELDKQKIKTLLMALTFGPIASLMSTMDLVSACCLPVLGVTKTAAAVGVGTAVVAPTLIITGGCVYLCSEGDCCDSDPVVTQPRRQRPTNSSTPLLEMARQRRDRPHDPVASWNSTISTQPT